MRKKMLKKMLVVTEEKLNALTEQNKQLKEKLQNAENTIKATAENCSDNDEKLLNLEETIANLKQENTALTEQKQALENEYSAKIQELTNELNNAKGDYFDQKMRAQNLEEALKNTSTEVISEQQQPFTANTPPKINNIESIDKQDPEMFNYASDIISKIVLENAKVKGKLEASDDNNKNELLALATGKTEMLKSDILKYLLSEEENSVKKENMNKVLQEAQDYFNGLLGQLA